MKQTVERQQIADAEVEEADRQSEVGKVVEFEVPELQMKAKVSAEIHVETAVSFCSFLLEPELAMTL